MHGPTSGQVVSNASLEVSNNRVLWYFYFPSFAERTAKYFKLSQSHLSRSCSQEIKVTSKFLTGKSQTDYFQEEQCVGSHVVL